MARHSISVTSPLPKRGNTSVNALSPIKVRGSQNPLPKHNFTGGTWPQPGGISRGPVKPLPGGGGGGGGTVGFPIDSG